MAAMTAGVGLTTATTRVILAMAGQEGGRADQVAQRLGRAIRLGLVLDGERLPPENQLAEQLGIATVTLREALAVLREQGVVVTRRGRSGGTFVRAPSGGESDTLSRRLRQLSTQDIRELADHRRAISAMVAQLAADRALPGEVEDLHRQVQRLGAAVTASERRRADTQLTIQLASAAQSSRLTRESLQLLAEVGDLLWLGLTDAEHEEAVLSRSRLVAAVARHDQQHARTVAEQQVESDTRRLLGLRLALYDVAEEV